MTAAEEQQNDLIQLAKSGDRAALEQLLIQHSGTLAAHIGHRMPAALKARFDTDDVTQRAMTEAFLKIGELRETSPGGFVAWLKAIAELTLLVMVRSETRLKRGGEFKRVQQVLDGGDGLVDLLNQLPEDGRTASQHVARRDAVTALQVGIAGLDKDQRRAVQLHLIQGKTLDETAEEMDCTTGAVRGLVHRAKKNLADAMGRASLWLSQG